MNRCLIWVSIISLGILLSHTAGFTLTAEEQQVAEGVGAIIKRNQAAARVNAINHALRKALEQALLETLDPFELMERAQALETRLYARQLNYIRSYRVLWEYPDFAQRVYRVGIEATLAIEEMDKAIQAIGLTQSGEGRGRLLVLIVEHHLERTHLSRFGGNSGVVAQTIRAYLDTHNFQTVSLAADSPWDGRESSAVLAGKRVGAGVVLIGRAKAEKVRSEVAGMSLQTVHASVQVQALATATGRRLAVERIEAMALHADAVLGGTQALRKAATEVASRLAPPLRKHLVVQRQVSTP